MNGIIYYTKIRDEYNSKNMEHMIGEKLLEIGLEREFGRKLAFEPRSKGEHGKPFFTLLPRIHYNITHSGKYVMCLFAGEEVGIDVHIQDFPYHICRHHSFKEPFVIYLLVDLHINTHLFSGKQTHHIFSGMCDIIMKSWMQMIWRKPFLPSGF